MLKKLEGKTAVITGGTEGIGKKDTDEVPVSVISEPRRTVSVAKGRCPREQKKAPAI